MRVVALALLFFAVHLVLPHEQQAQQSNATYYETTDWIRQSLVSAGRRVPLDGGGIATYTIAYTGVGHCQAELHEKIRYSGLPNGENGQTFSRYDFFFRNIESANVVHHAEYSSVLISSVNNAPHIRRTDEQFFEGTPSNGPGWKTISSMRIDFLDSTLAQRVARAFSHAISLCRLKQPF